MSYRCVPRLGWAVCLIAVAICLACIVPVVVSAEGSDAVDPSALAIDFGDCLAGTISSAGEVDTYTFSGNAGDMILLGMSRTSGSVWPKIRLSGSGLTSPVEASSTTHAEMTVRLPSTGTYTVLVSDGFNGTLTGDYDLFVQRLNDPGKATAISFGQTVSGTIAIPAKMDCFTFTATPGDIILLAASRESGSVWPQIRVYGPGGVLLASDSESTHVELTLQQHRVYVPSLYRNWTEGSTSGSGSALVEAVANGSPSTYVVLIGDGFNGTLTGVLDLHVQRLNDPGNASVASFGQTVTDTIAIPADVQAFTFDAAANDIVLFGASRASGSVWPQVRVYGPDGALIGQSGSDTHTELTTTVGVAGRQLVLLSDGFNGTLTGVLDLFVQRLNDPGNASPIASGQLITNTISIPAATDTYTFAGSVGQYVEIGMTRVSGSVWPKLSLYGPDGALVGANVNSTSVVLTRTLSVGGTYAVLAADGFNGTLTGEYAVRLDGMSAR